MHVRVQGCRLSTSWLAGPPLVFIANYVEDSKAIAACMYSLYFQTTITSDMLTVVMPH